MVSWDGERAPRIWERRGFWALFVLLVAGVNLFSAALAGEAPIVGRASVIDGDTIEIAGERVRFNGIDAPESRQLCHDETGHPYRCGQAAALALDGFLAASRPTHCAFVERDRYGRFVGACRRQDGTDVAAWLVSNGHALDWPRYSGGAYAADQEAARRARRGMWRGRFDPPWEWRRR